MELKELSTSLVVEYTECVSDSVDGNNPIKYDARWDDREMRVDMVVLCVVVLVSNDTMILAGSRELFGTGDTRIALNGDWGEGGSTLEGRGGTGGK